MIHPILIPGPVVELGPRRGPSELAPGPKNRGLRRKPKIVGSNPTGPALSSETGHSTGNCFSKLSKAGGWEVAYSSFVSRSRSGSRIVGHQPPQGPGQCSLCVILLL